MDMEHCIETGTPYCHRHHIFYGFNGSRKKSEFRGFVIPLAHHLHEFQAGSIHNNPNEGLDLKWKQKAQKYYEEHYGSREDFIKEFGKSHL